MAFSNPAIEAALKASIQRVVQLLASKTAEDAKMLGGKTLEEILQEAFDYTDQEIFDLVEGNALIEAVDEAVIAAGLPAGGEVHVAIVERLIDLSTGVTLDVHAANHFLKTITGVTAFALTGVPSDGRVASFTLTLVNGGNFATTFWPNIYWPDGEKPALTVDGRDVLAFTTHDGGLTWDGYHIGRNMKLPAA